MRKENNLSKRANQLLGRARLFIVRASVDAGPNIVDPFKHDQPAHPSLCEYITIEARQGVLAQAITQQAIAANPFIQYSTACCALVILQGAGQITGPAAILVCRRVSAA